MNKFELFRQIGAAAALSAQRVEMTDHEALETKDLQEPWAPGKNVIAGDRRQYNGKLYKCRQAHTTQADWTPDVYTAGWEVIDVTHAGTKEDPIPYSSGMQLFKNKYYVDGSILYLCSRDSEQAVYQTLQDLIGTYVETV